MKKLMLVATMVLGFVGMSFGQTSNSTINVDATVLTALTISSTKTDANFGETYAGVNSITLSPTNPATGMTAGAFQVSGEASHAINVSFSSTNLTNGATTLTYTPSLVGDGSSSNQGTASSVATGTQVTLASTGNYYFWVGGTLSGISSTAATGAYTGGTFTLTVSY